MVDTTIGLDIAKNVFQVHGVDETGAVCIRQRLRRAKVLEFFSSRPPCLVGLEACAAAHYWARELQELGHDVRLLPPAYVKPYVRRNKTDAADAAAICEAVTRPHMRFVAIKSSSQQGAMMLHRSRDLLIRQRTSIINALRAHMAEFGIVAAQGRRRIEELIAIVRDESDTRLPDEARLALVTLADQYDDLNQRVAGLNHQIKAWHRRSEMSQRLATIPGMGEITASAMAASAPDPSVFRNGRDFAAWLGLTPQQYSTGGKDRSGGISKRGDQYLRRLLVQGATVLIRHWRSERNTQAVWLQRLLARKPAKVAAIALANKMARIAWALMARGDVYRPNLSSGATLG